METSSLLKLTIPGIILFGAALALTQYFDEKSDRIDTARQHLYRGARNMSFVAASMIGFGLVALPLEIMIQMRPNSSL